MAKKIKVTKISRKQLHKIICDVADDVNEEDVDAEEESEERYSDRLAEIDDSCIIHSDFGVPCLLPKQLVRTAASVEYALLLAGAKPGADYKYLDVFKLAIEAEKVWIQPACPDSGKN